VNAEESRGSVRFAVQPAEYNTFRAQVVPQRRCGGLLVFTRTKFSCSPSEIDDF
jgi:hypothetical protein